MMKKFKKAGLITFCIVLILFLGGKILIGGFVERVNNISVVMPDLKYAADGVYVGEYTIEPVFAKVEVTIKKNELTNIRIVEHDNGLGSKAEGIVNRIAEKQSLEVDAVSGATVSSKCILKAVECAVKMAIK